jgi:hypothetical protein
MYSLYTREEIINKNYRDSRKFFFENLGKVDQGGSVEVWSPIPEFPGYSVSDLGRVRNDEYNGRILSYLHTPGGNVHVAMVKKGVQHNRGLAKLVAQQFLKQPNPNWDNPTPIYLNGNKDDCSAENLMWRPRWFAMKYTRQFNQQYEKVGRIRDLETDNIVRDIWTQLIMVHGLLFSDIIQAIEDRTYVFPTFQRFEWV